MSRLFLAVGPQMLNFWQKKLTSIRKNIRNLKEKEHEAYVGIGKKPHKVLTFPVPDISSYKTEPVVKPKEVDFLVDGWIAC